MASKQSAGVPEPARARSIAEYVRNMPLHMSPREVVEHAGAQGLEISAHYVANVRTEMRRRAGLPPRYGAIVDPPSARSPVDRPIHPAPAATARPAAARTEAAATEPPHATLAEPPPLRRSGDALEAQFLEIVLRLGLDRSDALLERVRTGLNRITIAAL